MSLTYLAVNKDINSKRKFADNHFHNISRLFDALPNFSFTTNETMDDYYLQTWYIRIASRVAKRLTT